MQSRTFSGFSIVRSMHEKGFYEMRLTMEFSAGVKKIKTFLKKLLFFFEKLLIFFKSVLIFWKRIISLMSTEILLTTSIVITRFF